MFCKLLRPKCVLQVIGTKMCSASYWDQNVFCKLLGPKCVLQVIRTKMCSAIQIIKRSLWLMQRMKAQIMLFDYFHVQICWVKHNAHAQV